jgi:hypothetical protein
MLWLLNPTMHCIDSDNPDVILLKVVKGGDENPPLKIIRVQMPLAFGGKPRTRLNPE